MRTARLLTVCRHALHREGVSARGVMADAPPVNGMTDRCKNITLPQLRFVAGGNNFTVIVTIVIYRSH